MAKHLKFLTTGRMAQNPPNPDFLQGVIVDMSRNAAKACTIQIPYPSPCCGAIDITCDECGNRVVVTVAGRLDDPHTVKMACYMKLM